MTDVQADLDLALDLAARADAITLARFGALDLHVEHKPDLTPVSDADIAVESALRDMLAAQRRLSRLPAPGDLLVEQYRSREGHHLFLYPFAGRNVHLGLANAQARSAFYLLYEWHAGETLEQLLHKASRLGVQQAVGGWGQAAQHCWVQGEQQGEGGGAAAGRVARARWTSRAMLASGRSLSSSDKASRSDTLSSGRSISCSNWAITTGVLASSMIASSSPFGRRNDTGCGVAPSFQIP